jgi:hypothetical protein
MSKESFIKRYSIALTAAGILGAIAIYQLDDGSMDHPKSPYPEPTRPPEPPPPPPAPPPPVTSPISLEPGKTTIEEEPPKPEIKNTEETPLIILYEKIINEGLDSGKQPVSKKKWQAISDKSYINHDGKIKCEVSTGENLDNRNLDHVLIDNDLHTAYLWSDYENASMDNNKGMKVVFYKNQRRKPTTDGLILCNEKTRNKSKFEIPKGVEFIDYIADIKGLTRISFEKQDELMWQLKYCATPRPICSK